MMNSYNMHRFMGYSDYDFSWIIIFFLIVLIIIGVVAVIYYLTKQNKSTHSDTIVKNNPIDILKERYARGEITKIEFDQMKKDLE